MQRAHNVTRTLSFIALAALLPLGACAGARPYARAQTKLDGPRVASAGSFATSRRSVTARRHVIRNGSVKLLSKTPRDHAKEVTKIAKELEGFVAHARHGEKRSTLTLRVPNRHFGVALTRLRAVAEVAQVSVRGRDVTARVVDLDLRLKTALKARQRYLELLAKAQSVAEALPVQKQLEKLNTRIEVLKGQLKLIKDQVALSTIHVELKYPVRPGIVGWVFYGLYKGVKWLFVWD